MGPAVGLNYVLLPSVLGGHKNLHQRPLHERHNGREWVWSWDCQTMGSSEAPRHAGWFDHPAVEEDQHEGSPALPDQGDLPVHLHRPGHYCQVWGEEEEGQGEDRRSLMELTRAQFESRIL